jgi:hypothetical protein
MSLAFGPVASSDQAVTFAETDDDRLPHNALVNWGSRRRPFGLLD